MTQYTLLDPITGTLKKVHVSNLTRNLQPNVILLRGDVPIGIITHGDIVLFCRQCTHIILSQCQKELPSEIYATLDLVDKWLEDPRHVSNEELKQAAETCDDFIPIVSVAATVARTAIAGAIVGDEQALGTVARSVAQSAYGAGFFYKEQACWLVDHLKSNQ